MFMCIYIYIYNYACVYMCMCVYIYIYIYIYIRHRLNSLLEIRRRRVFQAFSLPGAEQLQKLLSVGP